MSSNQQTGPGVSSDSHSIPLIDFAPFISSTSSSEKTTCANSVLQAFRSHGFIYLSNFGIPPSTVAETFELSKRFFERPIEQKESLRWTTPEANRGYVCYGREKNSQSLDKAAVDASRSESIDLKESMEIGREDPNGPFPNHWPDHYDEEGRLFKSKMLDFMHRCDQLHLQVMSAIAVGLGLGETYFDRSCTPGDNNLRLLHYPPVPKETFKSNPNQLRLGAHSDYGSITLLFQDTVGGLQVQSPSGSFIHVAPIANTVVVNAGDLLARWANDKIKSTLHRVVEPDRKEEDAVVLGEKGDGGREGELYYPARYAIAYFCNPNFDEMIETLPGTYESEEDKVYKEAIRCKDHLVQRLAATY